VSRADLIPNLYHPRHDLSAAERGVLTAALLTGIERDGLMTARFCDVAQASGMTPRGLRKMAERGACASLATWTAGTIILRLAGLQSGQGRNAVPGEQSSGKAERSSGSGTQFRGNAVPVPVRSSAPSRAGVTGLPSEATLLQAPPLTPPGGAAAARPSAPDSGPVDTPPPTPDLAEQGERIAATLTALESDPAIAQKREAFAAVCDALNRRGGLSAAMQGRLADLLMPEKDPETLWRLANRLGDSMGHVRNPVSYITFRRREGGRETAEPSLLDECREYARGLASFKVVELVDGLTPEARQMKAWREASAAADPEKMRAGFAACKAALEGKR